MSDAQIQPCPTLPNSTFSLRIAALEATRDGELVDDEVEEDTGTATGGFKAVTFESPD